MNILVLNASPKGKNSATVQTALYLQALHPEHAFTFLPVGQRIKSYESDFTPVRQALEQADLVLFCYPVYTFIAPYQLHRLMELIAADGVDLSGKFASQIITSKHFYDVTAHRYVEENCLDFGMKVIRGLSADMEDLLQEKGQREARMFFDQLIFSCAHGPIVTPSPKAPHHLPRLYQPSLSPAPKNREKDVVIVTNCAKDDQSLQGMIADFQAALPYESRVVNLRDFPFAGDAWDVLAAPSPASASIRMVSTVFSGKPSRRPMDSSTPSPSLSTTPIPASNALTTGSFATATAP